MDGAVTLQAYLGARLIDGSGADPIDDAALVVEGGSIVSVGPASVVTVAREAEVFDLTGLTLLPGLIDCHTHLTGSRLAEPTEWVIEDDRRQAIGATVQTRELMDHGITTVRDISRNGLALRWAIDSGLLEGPRIVACGPGISRTGGTGDVHVLPIELLERSHPWGGLFADGPQEVRKAVRLLNRMGVDAIKVWATGGGMWAGDRETDQHFDLEELTVLVHEATMLGLPVLAHCQSVAGAKDALRAGVASIEHGEELDDEARHMMVEGNVTLVPTLQLFLGEWFGEHTAPPRAGLSDLPGATLEEKERTRVADNFAAALEAGVPIAVGSDSVSSSAVPFGHITHREIVTMIELGMPAMDAIRAATSTAARLLRVDHETGSLEAGKKADFVAFDRDPLTDPDAFRRESVKVVARNGRCWKNSRAR